MRATKSTARRIANSLLAGAFALALTAQASPATQAPKVGDILKHHIAALAALHLHEPKTHETTGTIDGLGLRGFFHEWQDGAKQRRDETLGMRTQRVLRVGDTMWVQDANGDIRQLHGLVARRQVTEDFIDTAEFASHPENVTYLDRTTLPDGRTMYDLRVMPPKGESYVVGVDTKTYLIDEKSYVDGDAPATAIYADYRVVDGMLVPFTEIDSHGNHQYDITSHVTNVMVDEPIAKIMFDPLTPLIVANAQPVSVPLIEHAGLLFVHVTIANKPYQFLLDSGAQGVVFDPHVARELQLTPQGSLEIRGAGRVAAEGIVETPDIQIGTVTLPSHLASVVDLSRIVDSSIQMDGIIGYPLFAAAEIRINPDTKTMTIAKPGTLAPVGVRLDIDTDRQLPEVTASTDRVDGRFVVDTGNSNEVLLFRHFLDDHPGLVSIAEGRGFVNNRGIGGSTAAVGIQLGDLNIGPYHLYNRNASVILTTGGAFADRNDGGNIGYGVLRNFVTTFDLANHALYLDKAHIFDDGRFRSQVEHVNL